MQNKKPTQFVQAYIPLNPFAPEEKRVPALPVYAVPVSPVAVSKSATLLYSQNLTCLLSTRFFYPLHLSPACGFAVLL